MSAANDWKWIATGYSVIDDGWQTAARQCPAAGFTGIEGAPPIFEGMSDRELADAGQALAAAGIPVTTFHLPFTATDDIASFYESDRRKAVENVSRWMERAALLGAGVTIQHPTTERHSVDVEGDEPYYRQIGRSLETLLPTAERLDLVIALENMLPSGGGRFASRPEHLTRLGELFDHERLGFCLDTGHALISGGPDHAADFFEAMKGRLVAFHLADNAGDRDSHLAPGRGRVDWTTLFRGIAAMGYDGALCIETPPFGPGPPYRDADWAALLADTKRLAEQALA